MGIANCDRSNGGEVESRILTIRGVQVILDRDLAELYGVKTFRLNEQVKRNIKRFPERYRFQLTEDETNELIANCDRFESLKHSSFCPYAFTEHGVVMLSSVLHSDEAIEISGRVVDAFVDMRRFLAANAPIFQRLEHIEYKLLENDHKFDQVFAKLEEKALEPKQGIFFEGQVYDAQYPPIPIWIFKMSHDRFLIIDDLVYHVGASIKDLGKKWFAVSLMEAQDANSIITRLQANALSI